MKNSYFDIHINQMIIANFKVNRALNKVIEIYSPALFKIDQFRTSCGLHIQVVLERE